MQLLSNSHRLLGINFQLSSSQFLELNRIKRQRAPFTLWFGHLDSCQAPFCLYTSTWSMKHVSCNTVQARRSNNRTLCHLNSALSSRALCFTLILKKVSNARISLYLYNYSVYFNYFEIWFNSSVHTKCTIPIKWLDTDVLSSHILFQKDHTGIYKPGEIPSLRLLAPPDLKFTWLHQLHLVLGRAYSDIIK